MLFWWAQCAKACLCQQVIAEYLQKIDPKSDGAKRDWVAIYDECANVLYEVFLLNEFISEPLNWDRHPYKYPMFGTWLTSWHIKQ